MVRVIKGVLRDREKQGIHIFGKVRDLDSVREYAEKKGFKTVWLHRKQKKKLKRLM